MSTTAETNLRWDLSKLYKSPEDPAIEADLKRAAEQAKAIRDRYYGKVATLAPDALKAALVEQEEFSNLLGKLGAFASLAFSADTNSETIGPSLSARPRK